MDPAMLFPMIQQFITPDTIRGIAEGVGDMLKAEGVTLITTWDDTDTGEDYEPSQFIEKVFTAMVEQIGGTNDANTIDVPVVGWSDER